MKSRLNKGSSLIELMVGLSVIFVALISLVTAYNFFLSVAGKNTETIKAGFLLEEGIEAIRSIRDEGWDEFYNLPVDIEQQLTFNSIGWDIATSSSLIDGRFNRAFIIKEIYRDGYDDIAEAGYLDNGSRKIEVFVSWFDKGATTTVSSDVILANIFED